MTMLLTLASASLRQLLGKGKDGAQFSMLDLPAFTIRELRLHGLNLNASTLAGWSLEDLDKLRDRADKAACPCLVLVEDAPLPFADGDPTKRHAAVERVRRLAVAANRLGCSAVAVRCEGPDDDSAFEATADQIKSLMPHVERMELNLLLSPSDGLTAATERLTSLIKRIGGFRIGSLPTFGAAARAGSGDPIETLRKLAPYAGCIHATIEGFSRKGEHKSFDLAKCVKAIRNVGFVNTLAIEYVGAGDPVPNIEKARDILQNAIDCEAAA